ncbi:MAG: stage II sporulation protein R [Clostridia bacterium]|nr:stage II sporulation protein R [Clostridia bacterium]
MEKTNNRLRHAILALCVGVIITFAFSVYADKTEQSLSHGLIRLHVIANSDSASDQQLKLAVRDAIIAEVGTHFADNYKKDEARAEIIAHMEDIRLIAQEVIVDWGLNYPVEISLGKSDFPTKTYGDVTLPAGTYDALKVIIGSGAGQNWWCVLFPPLCFVDAATAEMPADSSEILKASLTEEEYAMVTNSGELPVQVKFKTYELWQSSKLKFKNMIAER